MKRLMIIMLLLPMMAGAQDTTWYADKVKHEGSFQGAFAVYIYCGARIKKDTKILVGNNVLGEVRGMVACDDDEGNRSFYANIKTKEGKKEINLTWLLDEEIASIEGEAFNESKRLGLVDEYESLNGIKYKIGDSIKLKEGSMFNGLYRSANVNGWASKLVANGADYKGLQYPSFDINYEYDNTWIKINKIRKYRYRGLDKVYFIVNGRDKNGGNPFSGNFFIDEAIKYREIHVSPNSASNKSSIADEIKKLNDLRKDGVLTDSEFEAQKNKILNN